MKEGDQSVVFHLILDGFGGNREKWERNLPIRRKENSLEKWVSLLGKPRSADVVALEPNAVFLP